MIRVLEELEEYALRYESERDEEHSLGRMVDKLDAEKRARAEERLRYERVNLCSINIWFYLYTILYPY